MRAGVYYFTSWNLNEFEKQINYTYHSFFQHKMVDTRTSNHPVHTMHDRCCYAGMAQTSTESSKKIERRINQVFIRSLTKDKSCVQVKKSVHSSKHVLTSFLIYFCNHLKRQKKINTVSKFKYFRISLFYCFEFQGVFWPTLLREFWTF